MDAIELRPIGWVESSLLDLAAAPKQGDEGAPDATVVLDERFDAGLTGIEAGTDVVILTWLDRADRDTLTTRPRDDPARPVTGVFNTRSPHRPNPIGLHHVRVLDVTGSHLRVAALEAIHGTPVLDVKRALGPRGDR